MAKPFENGNRNSQSKSLVTEGTYDEIDQPCVEVGGVAGAGSRGQIVLLPGELPENADPHHVVAANNLAEALARQGDQEQALAVIQTAVITAEQIRSPLLEAIHETRQEIAQALQEKNAVSAF